MVCFISIIDNDFASLWDKVSCFFPICFRIMLLNGTSIDLFLCHLFQLLINKKRSPAQNRRASCTLRRGISFSRNLAHQFQSALFFSMLCGENG